MKSVLNLVFELLNPRRAHSSATARRLGAEMCKELKTKVLRLEPPTSNGPAVHPEGHTGLLTASVTQQDGFDNKKTTQTVC